MEGGGGEDGVEGRLCERNILEPSDVEARRVAGATPGERDHVRPRVDRLDREPALDERFG